MVLTWWPASEVGWPRRSFSLLGKHCGWYCSRKGTSNGNMEADSNDIRLAWQRKTWSTDATMHAEAMSLSRQLDDVPKWSLSPSCSTGAFLLKKLPSALSLYLQLSIHPLLVSVGGSASLDRLGEEAGGGRARQAGSGAYPHRQRQVSGSWHTAVR